MKTPTILPGEHFESTRPLRLFAPCRERCPVHIDVPGYLAAIAEGRFTDALETVLERNPLPSVCGRVCLRPCEEGCRRCHLDEPVAIAQLKRAAADYGIYPRARPAELTEARVAVVGSGPAGLTAAHDLAQAGVGVTLFDEKPRLGGMLRYGIPNYRLPDGALDRDISHILSLGIEQRTGVRVGRDVTLTQLLEEFDAVVVTVGLQGSRALPIPGADLPGVLAALPFLAAAAEGSRPAIGRRVVVVGGGNVAIDVARTALRLGAESVTLTCLEAREQMPASDHEVEDACREGVHVLSSFGPVAVVPLAGEVCGLEAQRCLSVFDADGRFAPSFDESTRTLIDAETVIFATGQSADASDLALDLTPRGGIIVDPLTLKTSMSGVYAAGDVVSGPTRVIDAIAAGHRVSACVLRDVLGDGSALAALDEESVALGDVPEEMRSKLESHRRVQMEKLEFYEAAKTFREVELGYTEYEAAREAQRCLGCTAGARLAREKCVSCLTCVRVCPYGAPMLRVDGSVHFDAQVCHACGVCAAECPAQAISLEGHSEEEMVRRIERLLEGDVDATLVLACGCTPNLPWVPGHVHILTLTCLLRASESIALMALRSGASRVVFAGCVEANCRYPHARELLDRHINRLKDTLAVLSMESSLVVLGESAEEDVHLR